ncbi:MAG: prepilin peptidase [Acidimicrobiales bacterium]
MTTGGVVAGCTAGGVVAGAWLDGVVERVAGRGRRAVAGAVTGALLALTAARLGAVPQLAAYCLLGAGLVAMSSVDLGTGLVPRRILYPTLAVTAAALLAASAAAGRWGSLAGAAGGGAAAFGVFAAVWWIYPRGLGFGDVRLAGLVGMSLGWLGFRQLYIGFLAAFALGVVVGVATLVARGTTKFPFAPALAAGAMVGVLWGGYLGNLWLHG